MRLYRGLFIIVLSCYTGHIRTWHIILFVQTTRLQNTCCFEIPFIHKKKYDWYFRLWKHTIAHAIKNCQIMCRGQWKNQAQWTRFEHADEFSSVLDRTLKPLRDALGVPNNGPVSIVRDRKTTAKPRRIFAIFTLSYLKWCYECFCRLSEYKKNIQRVKKNH